MNIATYARRNLFRRTWRTILTISGVAIGVLVFCLIRTAVYAWNIGAEAAAKDRLATLHKVSLTRQFPRHYIDELRAIPDVKAATWAVWFGAKDPRERVPFFAGFAVDPESWFEVQDEMEVPPDQLAEWKRTPNGAIIGDLLAKAFDVKIGSNLVVGTDIYPGRHPDESDTWEFKVVGIYKALRKTVDRSTLVFRWDYLNNDPRAEASKDHIGWMVSRISAPERGAEIARRIDAKFEERDDQTNTMSERAFQLSFLGGFAALLKAFDLSSVVILLIVVLILANTIAMSVRERTHEYGVLRAIGFPPGHIVGFIVGEALLVGLIGGLVGVGLVVLLVNNGIGPLLENTSGLFPYFRTPGLVLALALGGAVLLGVVAGAVPAIRASRLKVTDALRRVD